jgi:hypothetical protein
MNLSRSERERLSPAATVLDKRADGSEQLTAAIKHLLSGQPG